MAYYHDIRSKEENPPHIDLVPHIHNDLSTMFIPLHYLKKSFESLTII